MRLDAPLTTYLVSLLLSFLVAVVLTPAMIVLAQRVGAVDAAGQSHRKLHAADIPRLGGLAIFFAFFAPLIALSFFQTRVGEAVLRDPALVAGLLAGGTAIAALGLYDDIRGASPRIKLGVQVLVAIAIWNMGIRIDRVDLPFFPMFDLGWLSLPITVLWIVGLTNAVNLIDGLDGLAAGMALFGILPMVVLAVSKGNLVLALVGCCLAGSVLGFLVYNFHPARIFMGDTGSMFLGFVLATVAIDVGHKGRVAVALVTPVLALGLPLLDTLLAIARRAWMGQNLFVGDRQHIHHRLMAAGFSHKSTVLVMYGFAGLFALLGLAVHFNRDQDSALLFVLTALVAGVLLRKVGYLALPGGDGASAVRERNRLVKLTSQQLEERLGLAVSLEAVAVAAAELAFAAGAARAALTLHTEGQPERTWNWEPHAPAPLDAVDPTERFALVDLRGRERGMLTVVWTSAGFHEAALPRLEAGLRRLAERLAEPAAAARIEPS